MAGRHGNKSLIHLWSIGIYITRDFNSVHSFTQCFLWLYWHLFVLFDLSFTDFTDMNLANLGCILMKTNWMYFRTVILLCTSSPWLHYFGYKGFSQTLQYQSDFITLLNYLNPALIYVIKCSHTYHVHYVEIQSRDRYTSQQTYYTRLFREIKRCVLF